MSTHDAGATVGESVAAVAATLSATEDALYDTFLSALAAAFPARTSALLRARDELATTRAQRDGLQRALDKANRDNDALRAELRQLRAEPWPTAAIASKLLVDRGEGDYTWAESEAE